MSPVSSNICHVMSRNGIVSFQALLATFPYGLSFPHPRHPIPAFVSSLAQDSS